ncbi:MAG: hypothetical protein ACOZQL_38305 [Myxococcota bacterium]
MLLLALTLLAATPCTQRSDCAWDAAANACGPAKDASSGERGPMSEAGTTCVCEAGQCQRFTVEPVACRSWRDCSFSREPSLHPVSSKQVPREKNRKVRPCKDAERDAVCDEQTKTCRLVAWKC